MFQGPPTRRRWFQFGMRTLFVTVTILAMSLGFVAYQLNWIRQRHEILSLPNVLERESHAGPVGHIGFIPSYGPVPSAEYESLFRKRNTAAPWPLRLFGERGVYGIDLEFKSQIGYLPSGLSDDEEVEFERVKRLFPETTVRWSNRQNRSILSRH